MFGKLGFSGPKTCSGPTRIRVFGWFGHSGKISGGSEFGRAAGKFLVSGRASVGQADNFRPNVQPCKLIKFKKVDETRFDYTRIGVSKKYWER